MKRRSFALPLSILLTTLLGTVLSANTGTIVTIVGTGVGGTGGVGGPAGSAQLTAPGGISMDSADNIFIADNGNNRVLRVDATTGIVTLVAGNGAASSTGDGGPAGQASINYPFAVALDGANNLYISEFHGQRIRRVDAQTGIITTVAGTGSPGSSGDGGLATSAALYLPAGIALDSGGNLYVADMMNLRIRRIDAQTHIITTVAGNGVNAVTADGVVAAGASLAQPIWVGFDRSGGLLISEWSGSRIRRVDPATGILSTVAGNGNPAFTGDGVPATSAGIGGPMGMTVDPAGNLFFADGTGRIRRVDATTGMITTVAGNGSGPHGMSSASAGGGSGGSGGGGGPTCTSTVIGDNGPATNATLDGAMGVQLTHTGNLAISDALDCRIRGVFLPSPFPYTNTTLAASVTTVSAGQNVTFTATVTPIGASGIPNGAIQFVETPQYWSPTTLGTSPVMNGTASLTLNNLSAGSHPIVAYYSGDSVFNGSGSPGVSVSVSAKPAGTVTLTSSQNPTVPNTLVTFTITVAPPPGYSIPPTGSVALWDNSTQAGSATLVNGTAQITTSFPAPGHHYPSVIYNSDANYGYSVSPMFEEMVTGPGSVTVTSAPNPSAAGSIVTLWAFVTPSSATGTVQFLEGSVVLATETLVNGSTCHTFLTGLPPGQHSIQGIYSGDGVILGASSAILTHTVTVATSIMLVSSSAGRLMGSLYS